MTLLRLLRPKAFLPFFISCTLAHAADPVVSNISAVQRTGTKLVDITYDVTADTATVVVSLAISNDGGITFAVPAVMRSGAIGAGIPIGISKTITWNAGSDWDGRPSSQLRFKVTANDLLPSPVAFATIPAGAFTMGTSDWDITDAPTHTVNVSAFYMAKNLVTKADWDTVRTWAISNGYSDLAAGAGKASNHPVQTVSWWDGVKYCNARSQQEGLTPVYTVSGAVMKTGTTAPVVNWAANGYRLPTEAEWEKAARGGLSGKRFPWGDTISQSQANYYAISSYSYDLSGYVNTFHPTYATGSQPYTSPVGSFAANGYGLHDMAGNVQQWCWDWHGTYDTGTPTDPRGVSSGTFRVFRGGGWGYGARSCRVARRTFNASSDPPSLFGFRVARSSVP
jgi:formylglycine-generating enzyme required for sulfatase activity